MELVYYSLPVDNGVSTVEVVLSQSHHSSVIVVPMLSSTQKQHRIGIFTVCPEYLLK